MDQQDEAHRDPQQQQRNPSQSQPGQQNQQRGNDADANGQPAPDSTNGGSTGGHYGEGISGGVDVGAIEPGRSGNGGSVNR